MAENGAKTEVLLILGTEEAVIDEKGRVLLAKKKRERLGADFVMTYGPFGCLVAYPAIHWQEMVSEILSYSSTNLGRQQYSRLLLSNAEDELNCDAQGRLVVPKNLRTLADLEKNVLLVGCGDRMEIWKPSEYARFEGDMEGYSRSRREAVGRAQRQMTGEAS